jgi:hypothetical protein
MTSFVTVLSIISVRKTNKQSHVDVDVTITNKNKSTKASTKETSSTKGNINKPEH